MGLILKQRAVNDRMFTNDLSNLLPHTIVPKGGAFLREPTADSPHSMLLSR